VTLITGNSTSRVIDCQTDPFGLGRWSYFIIRGKDRVKILVITAYCVCVQSAAMAGPKTSTSQQFQRLSKTFWLADRTDDPIPRIQFIMDLQAWIEHHVQKGCSIILGIDGNESMASSTGNFTPLPYTLDKPIQCKGHDGSLATLIRT
jgi:hypothetical protein